MPVARRGVRLSGDAADLPAGESRDVFFGCFARLRQIAGRSTSFLGVTLCRLSPRQASCATASPGDGEKATGNGMGSRKATSQQD